MLKDLGHQVSITVNRFKPEHLNLIFCYQNLPATAIDFLQEKIDYIVIQLEQLGVNTGWFANKQDQLERSQKLFQHALQIWDYSQENCEFLKKLGFDSHLIALGTHPSLHRFEPSPNQDIDVLFYGSVTGRRAPILKQLEQYCTAKSLFGAYGSQRDEWIARSKILLNLHYYENLAILEQVRLFYLLSNRCFVISENSSWNPYQGGIVCYPYEQLIEGVLFWLKKTDFERQQIANQGFEILQKMNSAHHMQQALAHINPTVFKNAHT